MLNELMVELQPILLNLAATILTALGSYVALKIKAIYQEKVNTETKQKVVETTCKYVEQIYKDLKGEEKLEVAKENIVKILNEKGISISETELEILIEATVNGFVHEFKELDEVRVQEGELI